VFPAIVATFLLRLAASAVGSALQFDLAERARAGGDVGATTLALLSVAFYAVELIGAPLLGARADRAGFRRLMLAGPIAGGLAALILQLPGYLAILLLARAGQGLSTAASVPATLGYISAATQGDPARRSRTMAYFEVATAVGLIGGLPLGVRLWSALGGLAYLLLAGVCALAFGAFLLVRDPATAAHPAATEPSLRDRIALLRQPSVLTFAPAWLAVNAAVGVWLTHGIFQLRRAGASPSQWLMGSIGPRQLGLVLIAFGVTFMVGLLGWSWLLPRAGVGRTLWVAAAGLVVATVSIAAINHLPDPMRTISVGLFVVGVLAESGFVPAALVRLAEIAEDDHGQGTVQRGLVMGTYSLVLGLGQLLGAAIAAPFAQSMGIDGLVIVTAALAVVAGVSLRLNLQSAAKPAAGAPPVD
jgi:MFS family permease